MKWSIYSAFPIKFNAKGPIIEAIIIRWIKLLINKDKNAFLEKAAYKAFHNWFSTRERGSIPGDIWDTVIRIRIQATLQVQENPYPSMMVGREPLGLKCLFQHITEKCNVFDWKCPKYKKWWEKPETTLWYL